MINIESRGPGRIPLDGISKGPSPRLSVRLTEGQLLTYTRIGGASSIRDFLDGLGRDVEIVIDEIEWLEAAVYQSTESIVCTEESINKEQDNDKKILLGYELQISLENGDLFLTRLEDASIKLSRLREMFTRKTQKEVAA